MDADGRAGRLRTSTSSSLVLPNEPTGEVMEMSYDGLGSEPYGTVAGSAGHGHLGFTSADAMSVYNKALEGYRPLPTATATTTRGIPMDSGHQATTTTHAQTLASVPAAPRGNALASLFGPIPQIPPFKRKAKEGMTSLIGGTSAMSLGSGPGQGSGSGASPVVPAMSSTPTSTAMPSFTALHRMETPSPSERSTTSVASYQTPLDARYGAMTMTSPISSASPLGSMAAAAAVAGGGGGGSSGTPMRNLNMYQPRYALNDFKLLDTLGTGTFGRVYLCQLDPQKSPSGGEKELGGSGYFAMKVLKKSEIVRLKQVEHINSEKDILMSVRHPFIVNLLCTFQDHRSVYMLLEYVIGGELFSHLRKAGRFTPDTTRFYASEIVLAIEYLHSQDIIYRDLKPENLLLDSTGNIKITDFGFAKRVEDRTWTLCGTPEYLAPEIIQSKGHGKAVDWWALGILIYEMLSGYPPFFDDNPFGIYEKILSGRLAFPSHIDPYGKDLIKRLLTIDRTKRLGNLRGGSEDIKRHKWFKSSDWHQLLMRRVMVPFIPPVRHEGDSSMFERYPPPPPEEPMPTEDPHYGLFSSF